ERSWAALQAIRARMQPGISEPEAVALAHEVFAELGSERLWHRPLIRIGRNTTKGFREPSEPGVRLGENDSYFIDLGLVFDGHEGDVGDTFVVGHAAQRAAAMGWRFNQAIKGHRVSDFPHAIHHGGDLGDLDRVPASGLWILEIQLAHPSEPCGAFHEDLLEGNRLS